MTTTNIITPPPPAGPLTSFGAWKTAVDVLRAEGGTVTVTKVTVPCLEAFSPAAAERNGWNVRSDRSHWEARISFRGVEVEPHETECWGGFKTRKAALADGEAAIETWLTAVVEDWHAVHADQYRGYEITSPTTLLLLDIANSFTEASS